ncbi:MAG TPA: lipoate--protein ligase family protein [Spirochaetota bacterium]|nr:lipoate--protein ligase family protein [Spirochaetota bacterium]
METWRLIIDIPRRGAYNMAVDLAILHSLARRACPPTLRLYSWDTPAVTIGYFQRIEEEVREAECSREGVAVIRRVTGGGAVLHEHELTYSVFIPLSHRTAAQSIRESYGLLCAPIVDALQGLGLKAEFAPVNDVLVEGAKVSGSAQTRREGVLLQHGTLLIDVDTERMFRILNVAKEKSPDGPSAAPEGRVTSLRRLLGERVLATGFASELAGRLARAFADRLGCVFGEGGLNGREEEEAVRIENGLFGLEAWNRDRSIRPISGGPGG